MLVILIINKFFKNSLGRQSFVIFDMLDSSAALGKSLGNYTDWTKAPVRHPEMPMLTLQLLLKHLHSFTYLYLLHL